MIPLLAQGGTPAANATTVPAVDTPDLFELITGMFSRADMLAHPRDMMPYLEAMSIVWAVIFLTAGLLCLFNGYRYYKVVVIFLALAIGVFAGYGIGLKMDGSAATNAPYIVAGCMGTLLAVVCFPLMKYAVALMGGLVGAFMGANAWAAIALQANQGQTTQVADHYWIGGIVGLLFVGMLAFILFKLSVVLFTSVSGATLTVIGAVALLLQVPAWSPTIADSISSHAIIVPLLVLVPALLGLIYQEKQPEEVEE